MTRTPNINDMTYAQLVTLQDRITKAVAQRKATDAKAIKDEMAALAQKAGFSVAELFGDKRKGKRGPVAVKYRNPKDASQTWTGRGRKPNWLVAELKRGAKIDSFAV